MGSVGCEALDGFERVARLGATEGLQSHSSPAMDDGRAGGYVGGDEHAVH